RCEICHQSDLFEPSNNHCFRCSNIKKSIKSSIIEDQKINSTREAETVIYVAIRSAIIGGSIFGVPLFLIGTVSLIFMFSSNNRNGGDIETYIGFSIIIILIASVFFGLVGIITTILSVTLGSKRV